MKTVFSCYKHNLEITPWSTTISNYRWFVILLSLSCYYSKAHLHQIHTAEASDFLRPFALGSKPYTNITLVYTRCCKVTSHAVRIKCNDLSRISDTIMGSDMFQGNENMFQYRNVRWYMDRIPTNKIATIKATQGKWNIDIEEVFCSSPPAPTPAHRRIKTKHHRKLTK